MINPHTGGRANAAAAIAPVEGGGPPPAPRARGIGGSVPGPIPLVPLPASPRVSVLMANHNYERYVGSAVRSVLAQTYPSWELLICDDGSTDGSVDAIREAAGGDPRIRLFERPNGGQAAAWNTVWPYARGEVVCLLDSDDLYEPEKLAVVVESFLRQPQVGLLVHRLRVVSSTGEPRQVIPFMTRFEQGWIAERVVRRGGRWRFLPTSGLCARRDVAAALFPLDEQLFRMWADSMLIYAGPLVTPIASLDRPLAQYRLHERNQSGTSQHTPRMVWHDLHSVHAPIKGANDRLEDLGRGRPFERRRNLQFVTQAFVLARLWGRPGSCRGYLGVMRAILKDDLYSWKQKLMGLVVYGVLVALPVSARGAWLDETLGMSRFKAWLQGLVSSRRPATTP